MSAVAIIPARGGSKRFPDKNLAQLKGKPLLQYSIDYALANPDIVGEVYVSTDSPAIAELALNLGVQVIERPAVLAGDHSPTVDSLKHALEYVEQKIEEVILLQPTNPLRPVSLLKDAWKAYTNAEVDSLMTVSRSFRKLGTIEDAVFRPMNYQMGQRSQDMTPQYYENGLLYITKATSIEKGVILAERNLPFIVSTPWADVDIDTPEDLRYAEFLLA